MAVKFPLTSWPPRPYFGAYYSILFEEGLVYVPKPLIKNCPSFESQFKNGHLNCNNVPVERAHAILHYIWTGNLNLLQRSEETDLARKHGVLLTLFKLRQDAHRFHLWGLEEKVTAQMHYLGRELGFLKLVGIALREKDWDFRGEYNWVREFLNSRANDRTEYIPEPALRRLIDWGDAELTSRMEELKAIVEFKIKLQELLETRLLNPFEGLVIWNSQGNDHQQDRRSWILSLEPEPETTQLPAYTET
ncbi:hypothetical protein NW762_007633 [Fusarium torreyae]|uniref:Uncharacterized protein n=1 Tax=Fusarium torreyae TaxID=1237075 RepID=A0A9W8S171_9HYPO|nr:hypothetical protein NW762_007633 [Fusarium torreyae]